MCVAKLPANMRSDVTEDGPPGTEVSIRPGHTITVSCVGRRTKLQGERKITCLSSGEWNIPFPKCVGGKIHRFTSRVLLAVFVSICIAHIKVNAQLWFLIYLYKSLLIWAKRQCPLNHPE